MTNSWYIYAFKVSLRILPSYMYSKALNNVKNVFARKALKNVHGTVNFGKKIRMSTDVTIGRNSGIGDNAFIGGPVDIGDNVMMGPDVRIYRSNHESKRTDIPMIEQGMTEQTRLIIGNDVWIGDGAIILPSCKKIGDGSIIGARAVVTKDIPDYSIVVGNPGRVVKKRK